MITKSLAITLLLLLTGAGIVVAQDVPAPDDWIQLFDGESLEGWIPKVRGHPLGTNFGNTFRVEDGVLKVAYEQYDAFEERFGHLFYEQPFSYYVLRVEYRFVDEQAPDGPGWAEKNSGIMVHGQRPETMTLAQDFPISIEVQLLGGLGTGERTTANLCTPGTHVVMDGELVTDHCISSASATYPSDEWVRAEVVVLGDWLIRHIVNGQTVLEYARPQIGGGVVTDFDPAVKSDGQALTGGSISLQSESHPVEFRTVELLDLEGCMDPEASNYASYYIEPDPEACTY